MLELEVLKSLAIALILGALIGLEREYAQTKRRVRGFAGIRTYPLIALFGGLVAYFSQSISDWILLGGLLALAGLVVISYYVTAVKKKDIGLTSEMAALVTFLVGVLCMHDKIALAAVIAIGVTILLYSRTFLHHFAQTINKKEMADTLKFAVIAFVILPFLPNKGYGPYEIFNPYIIWLMVVFISGISFVGYVLVKRFGEKGLEITGICGGLVSSTAVTTSFAQRSKKESKLYRSLVLGVVLANAIMFFRILVEVFVLNRSLFMKMLLPMGILALVSMSFAYLIWRKARQVKNSKVELSSPFTLGPALKFGIFFAFILALVKLADVYLSSSGVYLVSLISGFADVDAITLSLSQLARGELGETIARNGIVIAALTNVAVKGGIAYLFGGRQFGRLILGLFGVLILVGLGVLFLF